MLRVAPLRGRGFRERHWERRVALPSPRLGHGKAGPAAADQLLHLVEKSPQDPKLLGTWHGL